MAIVRVILFVVGILAILSGATWFLQGIGILPGSFMTGEIKWAVYGAISFLVGIALVVAASRLRRRAQPV